MEEENVPKKKKEETSWMDIFSMVIGFVLAIYGFLALVFPQNYPIDNISPQYTPLVGAIMLIVGIILIVRVT
jgi:uncharacterized membrane protein